jgi:hypothetical protein
MFCGSRNGEPRSGFDWRWARDRGRLSGYSWLIAIRLILIGLPLGLGLAVLAGHVSDTRSLLFGVSPGDSVMLEGAVMVLTASMAGLISTGMFGATAEAAGKNKGDDGPAATCAYLLSVINYPSVRR